MDALLTFQKNLSSSFKDLYIRVSITRAVIGWNSVLYQRTEQGLMTLSWLSNFCFGILANQ